MTTTTELKENIVKEYNETVNKLIRLEGALAALEQLTADDPVVEDETKTDDA